MVGWLVVNNATALFPKLGFTATAAVADNQGTQSWKANHGRRRQTNISPNQSSLKEMRLSAGAGSDRLPSTKKRIAARNWTETENQAARHAFGFVGGREKNNQRPDNRPIFYRSFVIEREDNSGRN